MADQQYTEADVRLVIAAISDVRNDGPYDCARSALDALTAAGRLLAAGWTVREQFGVTAAESASEFSASTVLPERSRETALERIAEEDDFSLKLVSRMISDWRSADG